MNCSFDWLCITAQNADIRHYNINITNIPIIWIFIAVLDHCAIHSPQAAKRKQRTNSFSQFSLTLIDNKCEKKKHYKSPLHAIKTQDRKCYPIVYAYVISRYFQRHSSDWSHKIIVHHAWELQKMLIFSSYQRCAACSRYFIPCILFLYSTRAETIARSSWLSLLISHNIHLSHSHLHNKAK